MFELATLSNFNCTYTHQSESRTLKTIRYGLRCSEQQHI